MWGSPGPRRVMQGAMSTLLSSWRQASSRMAGTNQKTCSTKSMATAMAATAQNCVRAGMFMVTPTVKATISHTAAAEMVGPTSARASLRAVSASTPQVTEDSADREPARGRTKGASAPPRSRRAREPRGPHHLLSKARVTMNMLSTPMARMRKGTTSFTIMVMCPPAMVHRPRLDSTESSTMMMPCRPRLLRMARGWGNLPSARMM